MKEYLHPEKVREVNSISEAKRVALLGYNKNES